MLEKLDFLVLGAQKCATSWLYQCLSEHPSLQLRSSKRERDYLGGDLHQRNGDDWYRSLYPDKPGAIRAGDVSVDYLVDEHVPAFAFEYAPEAKMIVSLRDPIDRAVSAYFWKLRGGLIPDLGLNETMQLAYTYLQDRGSLGAGQAVSAQQAEAIMDLLVRGFYDAQIRRYLAYYPPSRFLFVLFEDIVRDPACVLRTVYDFLGVTAEFRPASLTSRPKKNTYLSPIIAMQRLIPRSKFSKKGFDLLNQTLFHLGVNRGPPTLSPAIHRDLTTLFAPRIESLLETIAPTPENQRPAESHLRISWGN